MHVSYRLIYSRDYDEGVPHTFDYFPPEFTRMELFYVFTSELWMAQILQQSIRLIFFLWQLSGGKKKAH